MAIDLKKSGFAREIIGVDTNPQHAEQALKLALTDRILSWEQGVEEGDIIILAIPVQHIVTQLPLLLDRVHKQVVMDVGSTKGPALKAIQEHPARQHFVATHPMAGTEFSGPQAAVGGLFKGKTTIICDVEQSSAAALETVEKLYQHLGMPVIYMDSREHDLHAAYVSHISHISSFALALTVLEQEKDRENIFIMAGGGFDSTVRLAKSSREMWSPIFAQNSENVMRVLDTYIKELQRFKDAIKHKDQQELDKLITEANKIKKIL